MEIQLKLYGSSKILSDKDALKIELPNNSSYSKIFHAGTIKKDDTVVGILTGRQKEPMLPIEYHNDPNNKFAIPPKS